MPPGILPRATGARAVMAWMPHAGGNAPSAQDSTLPAHRAPLPETTRPGAITPPRTRPCTPGMPTAGRARADRTPIQPFVPQRGAGQTGRQQADRPPFISPRPPGGGQAAAVAPQAGGPVIQVTIPLTLDHHILGQAMARIDTSRALHEHRATGTAPDGLRHTQLPGRSIGA
ncbi:hypothetical protein [Komagataeibacter medellinensis]|uniref:hypothetical protein n=1 Tax=Komagataeibacter medellinensis TaxID=1177712 RepID=UPI0003A09917|nr:hypothetical protein [Komagataeibacter medellinensis]